MLDDNTNEGSRLYYMLLLLLCTAHLIIISYLKDMNTMENVKLNIDSPVHYLQHCPTQLSVYTTLLVPDKRVNFGTLMKCGISLRL